MSKQMSYMCVFTSELEANEFSDFAKSICGNYGVNITKTNSNSIAVRISGHPGGSSHDLNLKSELLEGYKVLDGCYTNI